MRYILLACAPARRPAGLVAPSLVARPIAPAGITQAALPGPPGAVRAAVDLSAIAKAADQRRGAASRAQKKPCRRLIAAVTVLGRAYEAWTSGQIGGILVPHSCPAQCGGTASSQTAKFRSAPCLPLNTGKPLPTSKPAVSPRAASSTLPDKPTKVGPGHGRLSSGRTPRTQTAMPRPDDHKTRHQAVITE